MTNLKEHFDSVARQSEFVVKKDNFFTLGVSNYGVFSTHMKYDFMNRIVFVHGDKGHTPILFADYDQEVLSTMRGILIDLGGKPPALPEAKNTRLDKREMGLG